MVYIGIGILSSKGLWALQGVCSHTDNVEFVNITVCYDPSSKAFLVKVLQDHHS